MVLAHLPKRVTLETTMQKIESTIDSGNFTMTFKGEVKEEMRDALVADGLRYRVERDVLSAVYLKLIGVPGKSGKLVMPKGKGVRKGLEFSPETALKFAEAAEGALGKYLNGAMASVGLYVSETKQPQYELAVKALERHESLGDIETWLANVVGYDGETHGEDGEFHPDAIKAVWVYANSKL